MYLRLFVIGLLLTTEAWTQPASIANPTEVAPQINASKLILVGDSTVAVGSGWGSAFCTERVMQGASCLNLARGGRSSGSYRAEGSWAIALAEARVPGYRKVFVLIQFGHNDQPGKPGRSTDLKTEFPANLVRYVAEVRAAGATPVLITPLSRRMWTEGALDRDLEPWAQAVRQVAISENVALLDLSTRSRAIVAALGPSVGNMLAAIAPPAEIAAAAAIDGETLPSSTGAPVIPKPVTPARTGSPNRPFDYTHLGPYGASLFAAVIAAEMARNVPDARSLLIP